MKNCMVEQLAVCLMVLAVADWSLGRHAFAQVSDVPDEKEIEESFRELRQKRSATIRDIADFEVRIEKNEAQLSSLLSKEPRIKERILDAEIRFEEVSNPSAAEDRLAESIRFLTRAREQLVAEIEELQRKPSLVLEESGQLDDLIAQRDSIDEEISRSTEKQEVAKQSRLRELGVVERTLENLKKEALEITKNANDLRRTINTQKEALESLRGDQLRVEDQINELLTPQTAKNEFKQYIATAFALLVAFVIVGFFTTAFIDPHVRQAIFSGDSGIQFITLFSLVIAIILFGITGILEGKELAALLGGISGYILGRSGLPSGGKPVGKKSDPKGSSSPELDQSPVPGAGPTPA